MRTTPSQIQPKAISSCQSIISRSCFSLDIREKTHRLPKVPKSCCVPLWSKVVVYSPLVIMKISALQCVQIFRECGKCGSGKRVIRREVSMKRGYRPPIQVQTRALNRTINRTTSRSVYTQTLGSTPGRPLCSGLDSEAALKMMCTLSYVLAKTASLTFFQTTLMKANVALRLRSTRKSSMEKALVTSGRMQKSTVCSDNPLP